MINVIKKAIDMEESLKKRLEIICDFCKTKPIFINGKTNLSYIEPHRIIIKGITFLVFNYSTDIYVGNLTNKMQISELEDYLSWTPGSIVLLCQKLFINLRNENFRTIKTT